MTGFPDTYLFESILPAPGSHYLSWKRHSQHLLEQEDAVEWAVQQQEIRRDKRDVFYFDEEQVVEPHVPLNDRLPLVIGNQIKNYPSSGAGPAEYGWKELTRKHRLPLFNDELWDHEWYLVSRE